VTFTSNGQETIDLVKQIFEEGLSTHKEGVYKPIDLIITDFQMPVKNGLQVVQEI
jgi:CheY-like chemotaxis protein